MLEARKFHFGGSGSGIQWVGVIQRFSYPDSFSRNVKPSYSFVFVIVSSRAIRTRFPSVTKTGTLKAGICVKSNHSIIQVVDDCEN